VVEGSTSCLGVHLCTCNFAVISLDRVVYVTALTWICCELTCRLREGVARVKELVSEWEPPPFLRGTLDGEALDKLVQVFEHMEGYWGSKMAHSLFTNTVGLDLTLKRFLEACVSIPLKMLDEHSEDINRYADLQKSASDLREYESQLSVMIEQLQHAVGETIAYMFVLYVNHSHVVILTYITFGLLCMSSFVRYLVGHCLYFVAQGWCNP
jgi:hypothetical protein